MCRLVGPVGYLVAVYVCSALRFGKEVKEAVKVV